MKKPLLFPLSNIDAFCLYGFVFVDIFTNKLLTNLLVKTRMKAKNMLLLAMLLFGQQTFAQTCNIVSNGTFAGGSGTGWTSSGGWAFQTTPRAVNSTDGANGQTLSQTLIGLNGGPIANQVTINFDLFCQQAGQNSTAVTQAKLEVLLNGTVYVTFDNPSATGSATGKVTATTSGSASLAGFDNTSFPGGTTGNAFTDTGISLTIPWPSGSPNSAVLTFRFTAPYTTSGGVATFSAPGNGQGGDDFGIANISNQGSCPPGGFTFNCGSATSTGIFLANSTAGQAGTLVIPITGAVAGPVTLTVAGTGFTGTLTTTLTTGQTSVTVPITYDGTGSVGNRTLTITSTQGTGACTKSVLIDIDTDGDGIPDSTDIDDDNDGVLDSVECVKTSSSGDGQINYKVWNLAELSSGDAFYSSTTLHRNNPTSAIKYGDFPNFTANAATITGTTAVVFGQIPWVDVPNGGSNPNNGSFAQIEGFLALPCYSTLQVRTLASGTPASVGAVREDFTTLHLALDASGNATTNTANLQEVSYQKVNFSGTIVNSTEYTFTNTNSSGQWIAFGNAISDGADFYGALLQWNVNGAGWVNIPATAFSSTASGLLAGCVCADTDNDGIPNYLDLDSDNDGCSDAFEANATTSLTTNFKFTTAVGTNGLANSLETVVDNGTINYTSTYAKAIDNTIKTCFPPVTANTPAPKSGVTNSPKTGDATTELVPVGGNGTYTYSVDNSGSCTPVSGATALPASSNLTVTNASTGAYTFTTPAAAGTYYYCIKVCDTATPTPSCVTKTYTLTVTAAPTPLTAVNPPAQTATPSQAKTGNVATELTPAGGDGNYVYSADNSGSCTPIAGATALPSGSNLTITNSTSGIYTYTAPTTAGTHYYCIKVCDTTTPTANCVTKTYKLTVTAPPSCSVGTAVPTLK